MGVVSCAVTHLVILPYHCSGKRCRRVLWKLEEIVDRERFKEAVSDLGV